GLSDRLMERLREKAEGVIVAGPPGSGKSTFAASLAEFYTSLGKVVKTLESPRDLQVGPEITQYGPLEGDFEKSSEILLLVRPAYTVFDEIRKTKDFQVFADMRLAGVGMIGIVHASGPIDAIQRFMGRVELGMIPHTIDTIIFVKFGEIIKVYELSLIVKVPTGMVEADLARPVVEVRDFESGKLEYEIYTFGEENIIIPVQEKTSTSGVRKLAADRILEEISKFDPECKVELADENHAIVRVQNNVIARVIGKEGANISRIEDKLGIRISVEPRTPTMGRSVRFDINETGNSVVLTFRKETVGKTVAVFIGGQFLFSAIVGKKAQIKMTKKSELGKSLLRALVNREEIGVML
ncbi:MAG: ATPase, T2SS/T4P/T4SS family, partial [Candidatus Bathyarchaeia archaeon]